METLLAPTSNQYIMKIALTNMNLGNDRLVQSLIDFLHVRKHL